MDHNRPMHIDTNITTLNEVSSLLRDSPEIRPYQAYCDTETSSCPSSPENLSPSPLQVMKVHLKQADMSTQASAIDASEQEISLTRVATSSTEKQVDFPRSFPAGNQTRKRDQGMNQSGFFASVSSATSGHIPQPINPRGSHLQSDDEVTAYDSDPAITRVQLSTQIDRVTELTKPRKPVPENGVEFGTIYRPLPQVPLGKVKVEIQDQPESTYENGCVQCPSQTMGPANKRLEESDGETSLRGRRGGKRKNIEDETTADSLDRFEEIDFGSPNAQPPRRPEPAFQTCFNQHSDELFLQVPTYTRPHPASSLHSSTDLQNGPRPPPWGTYDNLALQRRQRNELRGRMQGVPRDVAREPALTYQQTLSVELRGEGLSREVNEYREQILSVYPDMVFDGHAGDVERKCGCCSIM
ncbi:hypothetical protein COCMIDRAFT_95746 [Bipolaris oryzae ATCC 44560]|uniref:Uncharacterized protein n=1 Tax=Bipolaris oryzae ATCC 44560 TaxID=930090 RepID=W6ZD52_COCMI|nr:uncharacterized protein COCMIDRAFT_95746 [Bipolaris oryzae ATCC 44560]EUC45364.1 hypothetical protein COCMIDRAFT_95746 [Bipolaris oryzae ATCC 44560]